MQILELLIAKIASNEAQTDANVETLARFVTLFEVILASAQAYKQGRDYFLTIYGEIV